MKLAELIPPHHRLNWFQRLTLEIRWKLSLAFIMLAVLVAFAGGAMFAIGLWLEPRDQD